MKLYSYWRSSCSWRVRIALAHKGVEYEYAPVHLVREGGEQHLDAYQSLNTMAQVPTLEWDEAGETRSLSQSLAILSWIEARHPTPPLLPKDPYLAARAKALAELVNAGIQPLQNLSVIVALKAQGLDGRAFGKQAIARGLKALDRAVAETHGVFCVGDAPSWADVCLVPQLYNARRFEVDLADCPRLIAIEERCAVLPAFLAAHPDQQPDAPPPDA